MSSPLSSFATFVSFIRMDNSPSKSWYSTCAWAAWVTAPCPSSCPRCCLCAPSSCALSTILSGTCGTDIRTSHPSQPTVVTSSRLLCVALISFMVGAPISIGMLNDVVTMNLEKTVIRPSRLLSPCCHPSMSILMVHAVFDTSCPPRPLMRIGLTC